MWAWKAPGGGVCVVLSAAKKLLVYDALASDGKSDLWHAKQAGDIALALRKEHVFTGFEGAAVHVLEQTALAIVAVGSSNVRSLNLLFYDVCIYDRVIINIICIFLSPSFTVASYR